MESFVRCLEWTRSVLDSAVVWEKYRDPGLHRPCRLHRVGTTSSRLMGCCCVRRSLSSKETVVDAALAYDRQSPQIPTLLLSRFVDQNMPEVERSLPRPRPECQGSLS